MHDNYKITGSTHKQHKNQSIMDDPKYLPDFQKELTNFKNLVSNLVNKNESKTFIHHGDGDYYFLIKKPVGSAKPGKRALSVSYRSFNIKPFKDGFLKNDYICLEAFELESRKKFKNLFPNTKVNFHTEFLYALVANRWFFKQFKGKIGLIGADEKLKLIQELLKHKEYQEYLGLEKFNDYISIPQKFACDNLEKTEKMVAEQLKNSTSNIFLFGVGHVKSGLIHRLKKYKKAVYIDIGSGIDAIAGIIDPERPYFAGWTNYQLLNFDYKKIDLLQYHFNGKIKKLN